MTSFQIVIGDQGSHFKCMTYMTWKGMEGVVDRGAPMKTLEIENVPSFSEPPLIGS